MNCQSSKVILKKLQRIKNINKHTYNIVIDISKGATEIRPVYKVPDKLTIIDTYDELIKILYQFNINFAVSNDAPRRGKIGTIITIKTRVIYGNNRTKTQALTG